jgi:AraC-like DNA-binding protein
MNPLRHKELISLVNRHALANGTTKTAIPGVSLFRASVLESPVPSVYNPCLCIIAQGHKDVGLDKEKYHYGPLQYLTVSVDLPLMNKITKASRDKPYLLIKIDIDIKQLSDLLFEAQLSNPVNFKTKRGIFVGDIDEEMGDAVLRLARLLNNPEQIPVLAYQTLKEIYYRVLLSKNGGPFSQIALKASPVHNIAKAIVHLKNNFRESIPVKDLANIAGMSISAFHSHFKSVTSMSPLQYQKKLRLIEARALIVNNDTDIANAGYQVGYQSASQFSREYVRMFGKPPKKDIEALRKQLKTK